MTELSEHERVFAEAFTPDKIERRRRIIVSAWAYAYEIENDPLASDAEYDEEARLINPQIDTGRPDLDAFFRTEFSHETGQWVHKHPELGKLAAFVAGYRERRKDMAALQSTADTHARLLQDVENAEKLLGFTRRRLTDFSVFYGLPEHSPRTDPEETT